MNPSDQKKITKNLMRIRKTIKNDVSAIADRLVEEKLISAEVRSEICNVRPSVLHLQCGVLINTLLRSGPEAYGTFIKVLEEKGYNSLIACLENSGRNDCDPRSLLNDREKTFIIASPRIPTKLLEEQEQPDPVTRPAQSYVSSDEVRHMERMMTVVLSTLDQNDRSNSNIDFKNGVSPKVGRRIVKK